MADDETLDSAINERNTQGYTEYSGVGDQSISKEKTTQMNFRKKAVWKSRNDRIGNDTNRKMGVDHIIMKDTRTKQ